MNEIRRYPQYLFTALLLFSKSLHAQKDTLPKDSIHFLKEVIVTGFQANSPKYTSLNIEAYSVNEMKEHAPLNLSDALSKVTGMSQITTGNSISKPVIRGLYGNRILILLSGARFDNQQWQDEHGLGLSQIGIEKIEVIKGPASLLYGSDALGGVINVIEEKPLKEGKKWDFGTSLFSNSMGSLTDMGYSKKRKSNWWRMRVGAENHADYSDGKNQRVLNSRNSGYYLKVGIGFDKAKWKQENAYNFSYNQYGFILEELSSFMDKDKRWNYSMTGPHHIVFLNLVNSQNTFLLKKSILKINAGLQSNKRMEDEGSGQISLNMHLFSALQNLKWEKNLSQHIDFVFNQQFSFENNTNYGGRIIVPDANMLEANGAAYFKFYFSPIILEAGVGANAKNIHTFATAPLNSPNEKIQPFSKNHGTANALLGLTYNPKDWLTIKANSATGYRAGNLAELSSNGIHEGVYRYELGNPNLKVEQNLNSDLSLEMDKSNWFVSLSGFYTKFQNYIYLAPTSEKFYSYQVFRYRQQNAILQGFELQSKLKPKFSPPIEWKESIAFTQGKLQDGGNLPFIPACKIATSLRFQKRQKNKNEKFYFEPEFLYVFAQNNPAQFETRTPQYFLLNVYSGIILPTKSGTWELSCAVKNATNKAYADHLSRLKNFGILNQGINFIFNIRKSILN